MGNIPRKNITAKILALIMAAVLWMYVMNEQNPPVEASLTIPLEVQNLAANYIVAEAPDSVRVKVKGPRNVLAAISSKEIKSYVDLKGIVEGKHALKVHTVIPASLELTEVNPDQVLIRVDTNTARQMPVDINYTGTASAGAVVGKAAATPTQVAVEGPKTILDTVDRVVAMVDLTARNADFSADTTLVVVNRDGKPVDGVWCNPAKVKVTVAMTFGTDKKTVDIQTNVLNDLPTGISVKKILVEPDKLEIHGQKQELDKIDTVYTEPISLAEIRKDTDKEMKLVLPEGITTAQPSVIVHIYVVAGAVAPPSVNR